MNRRDLLQACAAIPLTVHVGTLFAAPATQSRLLFVFLRGAYDAASVLVPVSSQFYYDARPNIAIARPGTGPDSALPLNVDWGLHPALRDTILPLFGKGQAAFIPFAGTDNTSRSHFETQDSIELGQPLDGRRDYRSGFLNRLVATIKGADALSALSFTDQLPLIFQGGVQVPNTALRSTDKQVIDPRQSNIIAAMYNDTVLKQQVNDGFQVRAEVMREMTAEMDAASRNAINTKGFEGEAHRIAKLMKQKYQIGFIDIGGWDTHVAQGGATGYLATRLGELGRGLAGFAQEMGPSWSDTVVVVISEFGRTLRENGNRGTDHGHGTVFWVLGGSIRGGRIVGEQVKVDQSTLFQNRDYPVLNEYRAVLGGLFARMYGLDPVQIGKIFSGVKSRDLGLI